MISCKTNIKNTGTFYSQVNMESDPDVCLILNDLKTIAKEYENTGNQCG